MSKYSQGCPEGQQTHEVPFALYKENRRRLVSLLLLHPDAPRNATVLLRGADDVPMRDTDACHAFRQDNWFAWAFGVPEPGFAGAIDMAGRATLFIPRLDPSQQAFMGPIPPPEHYLARYEVDEVRFVDEIADTMEKAKPSLIYLLSGINSDSGLEAEAASFMGIARFRTDRGRLREALEDLRPIKTPAELEVMRYVVRATCAAHKAAMRECRPGKYEYQLESTFLHTAYHDFGCRMAPWGGGIVASGPNASILHYGHAGAPNSRRICAGDIVVLDMGAEYNSYDGDVTCTYPASGKFSPEQREIYEAVFTISRTVEAAMRPGVHWPDMHRLAYRVLCEQMVKRGFLQGDIDEMLAAHVPAVLMPHGLGHLLGLDTHDVGGYPHGQKRSPEPGLKWLRTNRKLEVGMVLTVEPGIYFIEHLLTRALEDPKTAKFFVAEKIKRFIGFGGVRIEDDVAITPEGIENMSSDLPRTVEQVEEFMATGTWSK